MNKQEQCKAIDIDPNRTRLFKSVLCVNLDNIRLENSEAFAMYRFVQKYYPHITTRTARGAISLINQSLYEPLFSRWFIER